MNVALRSDILAKNCPKICAKRRADCHSVCPRYKRYRKALDKASEEERQRQAADKYERNWGHK